MELTHSFQHLLMAAKTWSATALIVELASVEVGDGLWSLTVAMLRQVPVAQSVVKLPASQS